MKRRDFAIGLLLASAARTVRAQETAKQHRIAIVRPAGSVALISETGIHFYKEFFKELRHLGDVEGQNLTVERFSGEGRPERFSDLAREVVNRDPDLIVVSSDDIARAVHAANGAMPIVLVTGGDLIQAGFATSLSRPGGIITGVTVQQAGSEMDGKRLQLLKEAVPAASKAAYLTTRVSQVAEGQQLSKAGRRLQISGSSWRSTK